MSPEELQRARDLVDSMEEDAAAEHYFEIDAFDARLLAQYIRELERTATKLRSL